MIITAKEDEKVTLAKRERSRSLIWEGKSLFPSQKSFASEACCHCQEKRVRIRSLINEPINTTIYQQRAIMHRLCTWARLIIFSIQPRRERIVIFDLRFYEDTVPARAAHAVNLWPRSRLRWIGEGGGGGEGPLGSSCFHLRPRAAESDLAGRLATRAGRKRIVRNDSGLNRVSPSVMPLAGNQPTRGLWPFSLILNRSPSAAWDKHLSARRITHVCANGGGIPITHWKNLRSFLVLSGTRRAHARARTWRTRYTCPCMWRTAR